MILYFMSEEESPRAAMTFRSAEERGSRRPSRMNIRQKSFLGVGLCENHDIRDFNPPAAAPTLTDL